MTLLSFVFQAMSLFKDIVSYRIGLSVSVRVFIDISVASRRRYLFHASAMTFSDARMECVANNGDLPNIENNRDLEDVITNITVDAVTEANNTRSNVASKHADS